MAAELAVQPLAKSRSSSKRITLLRASELRDTTTGEEVFRNRLSLSEITGRLVELIGGEGSADVTIACSLILEAQLLNEPAAWITHLSSIFYPPDLAESGADLDALPVIRLPDGRAVLRAADHLIRSGSFGLVVLDLFLERSPEQGLLGRLIRLAENNRTAVLCLMRSGDLGSMVSLRGKTCRRRSGYGQGSHGTPAPGNAPHGALQPGALQPGRFYVELKIIKDKRRGPGRVYREECRGPAGLC